MHSPEARLTKAHREIGVQHEELAKQPVTGAYLNLSLKMVIMPPGIAE